MKVGSGSNRYKIQQLQAILHQKQAQVAKLERIHQTLFEKEQVVSQCIAQQGDMLHHLGLMCFALPDANDAGYEYKAKAAVVALLKDMEAAQLLQLADGFSPACSAVSSGCSMLQQAQGHQQPCEHFTNRLLRSFLSSPDCIQTMQQVYSASLEELAALARQRTMELGFALATYPTQQYLEPAAVEAQQDEAVRARYSAANKRLQESLDAYINMINLLHTTADKVLNLSLLDLETMQPDTPSAAFWEGVAARLQLREPQAKKLHMGFLWYNSKRSILTGQMQQTMQQLQQILGPVQQQQQQQPTSAAATSAVSPGELASSSDGSTGVMLERLEDADSVLQQLGRLVWQLREVSRCLIYQFMNTLDPLQLSVSIVHSFPYITQPPPIIEAVVKQRVAAQQELEKQQQQQGQNSGSSASTSVGTMQG